MQLPTPLLSLIETAINTWLRLDPEAMPQFYALQDKIIRLHITGLELNLYFFPSAYQVQVLGQYAGKADTTIHGSPLALMRLATTTDAGKTLLDSDAYIEGDIGTGTQFSQVLGSVEIDWEEFLSRAVGDIIAHQAGNIASKTTGWLRDSEQAMRLNLGEYITEEEQLAVTESEVNGYLDQVDVLRADTDRLDARIRRLRQQLDTGVSDTVPE